VDVTEILILFGVGFLAGIINTLAGGGSLLTLPLLIFLGLPPNVANATNRIGVWFNAFFAMRGFKSKGVDIGAYGIWLGVVALFGAALGSFIAVDIKGETFNKILAILIIFIIGYMVFGNKKAGTGYEKMDTKSKILGFIAFFGIGVYGGFIQAGVGYLIMSSLAFIHRFDMVKINMIKALSVVIYTLSAIGIFIFYDLINWELGIALAIGSSLGGWLTSRWSTKINDKYLRYFVMITAFAFAVKLFFF